MSKSSTLVAARFLDGRVVKGETDDFRPGVDRFHVLEDGQDTPTLVPLARLKAVFFIKSLEGDASHDEAKSFVYSGGAGTKVWVEFSDGEELAGWAAPSVKGEVGFFLYPTDVRSNLEKVFVLHSSLERIVRGERAEQEASRYGKKTGRGATAFSSGKLDNFFLSE